MTSEARDGGEGGVGCYATANGRRERRAGGVPGNGSERGGIQRDPAG